jgi:hypothetical protein
MKPCRCKLAVPHGRPRGGTPAYRTVVGRRQGVCLPLRRVMNGHAVPWAAPTARRESLTSETRRHNPAREVSPTGYGIHDPQAG